MMKQRIIVSLWWLLALAVTGLLVAAVQRKKATLCTDIKVEIEGIEGHVFVDETDIASLLQNNGCTKGTAIENTDLRKLENLVSEVPWIRNAELYFDNTAALQVKIKEREPIARLFTAAGASFYIDSGAKRLPLSKDYSASVPMFTSFTGSEKKLSKPDSILLEDVKKIALYIQHDTFWRAQVSQVVITPRSTFEIIPVVGNQRLKIGKADSLSSKFNRLYAFYKQVWAKSGFEKYETVSVEFSGQVIATKRGMPRPLVDSALAWRVVNAMRAGVDILKDSSLLLQTAASLNKNATDTATTINLQPLNKKAETAAEETLVAKQIKRPKQQIKPDAIRSVNKPKATMPKAGRKQ